MTGGYRGADCGYTGAARFDEHDEPTSDPAKDRCGGRLSSCKLRFGEHSELPHGGFPAVSLIARS
ncbi:Phage minor tail protein L [compost metagenome]